MMLKYLMLLSVYLRNALFAHAQPDLQLVKINPAALRQMEPY